MASLSVFVIIACSGDDDITQEWQIAPVLGWTFGEGLTVEYFINKGDGQWQLYQFIENLNYEEGYLYRVQVVETAVRPSQQDASNVKATVVKLISKTAMPVLPEGINPTRVYDKNNPPACN